MWQLYAILAHDLLEDRRREAAAARRYKAPAKRRRSAARLVKRIVTGRGED